VSLLVLLGLASPSLAGEEAGAAEQADAAEAAPAEATQPAEPGEGGPAAVDSSGFRAALLRKGVSFQVEVTVDASTNVAGGLRRGAAVRGPLLAGLAVETAPLIGWRRGRVFAGFQAHQGRHGSEALAGDAQGFDNVDAVRFRQLSELWYEQDLLHEAVRLRVGKQDANAEFASVESAGDFLSSSAGFSPTIVGLPSYPDPATGASLSVSPRPWVYARAGLFDGATHEGCHGRTGNRGPGTLWGDPDALFLIAETGFRWAGDGWRSGRVAAGAWRHTGTFERFEGGQDERTEGTYLVFEQAVWSARAAPGARSATAFAQLGWADGSVSDIDRHRSVGLAWTGPIPGRDRDVLGAMVSSVRFSDSPAASHVERHETAFEAFYLLQLASWAALQSDLQVVRNPGGSTAGRAVLGTVRVKLAF
jgi:porin